MRVTQQQKLQDILGGIGVVIIVEDGTVVETHLSNPFDLKQKPLTVVDLEFFIERLESMRKYAEELARSAKQPASGSD